MRIKKPTHGRQTPGRWADWFDLTELSPNADELRFVYRAWLVRAIFFLLAVPCAIPLLVLMPASIRAGRWDQIIAAVLCGLMAVGLLAVACGRWETRIDRSRRVVEVLLGVAVWCRRWTYPFDDLSGIAIKHSTRRSRHARYDTFVLALRSGTGDVYITESAEYLAIREKAEDLARFIEVPLVDESTGQAVTREPGELNESVVQRLAREAPAPTWPTPPDDSRIRWRVENDDVVVDVPPESFGLGNLIVLGVSAPILYFGGLLLSAIYTGMEGEEWEVAIFTPLLVVVALLFLGLGLWMAGIALLSPFASDRLTVSRRRLRIETRYPLWTSRWECPLEHLEECSLHEQEGEILLRGDHNAYQFRAGHTPADRAWLYAVLRYVMCHGPPEP